MSILRNIWPFHYIDQSQTAVSFSKWTDNIELTRLSQVLSLCPPWHHMLDTSHARACFLSSLIISQLVSASTFCRLIEVSRRCASLAQKKMTSVFSRGNSGWESKKPVQPDFLDQYSSSENGHYIRRKTKKVSFKFPWLFLLPKLWN